MLKGCKPLFIKRDVIKDNKDVSIWPILKEPTSKGDICSSVLLSLKKKLAVNVILHLKRGLPDP